MNQTFLRSFVRTQLCLGLLLGSSLAGHTQISIGGLADKTIYTDQVTFTVTNQPGYTYAAWLDSNPVPVGSPVLVNAVDYHELSVFCTNTSTAAVTSQLVRFILSSGQRSGCEDGLPPWTPWPTIPSSAEEFAGAHLRLVVPSAFPAGYPVPVVAWVENDSGHARRATGLLTASGHPSVLIRRGVGSGFLAATNPAGTLTYCSQVAGLQATNLIEVEASTSWIPAAGTLPPDTSWPPNSRIYITGHLTNSPGSTLNIGAGTIVRIAPAIDIYNSGQIAISGSTANPVVFMPANSTQPWGGIIQHANNAAFTATGAIFTGSGANQGCWFTGHGCSSSLSGISSHRPEQALISLKGANCQLSLTDCAAISLAGQFGHSAGGVGGPYPITLTRFLMQRCTTGGEYTDAAFRVNDSAFLECPDDSANFADGDNDGLYIVNGTHGFTNSIWGWTKDDGVDSGGSGAGNLNFQDCWFESTFHEGNSLSGTGKLVSHYHSVFLNCGQALEAGYDGPSGTLSGCLATANLVGGRFGDNYSWSYSGFLRATNSLLLHNYHDVWGMNWQDWTYRASAMNIQSNLLTAANSNHPNNVVWDPARDGEFLAAFMTTPPEAAVGLGLAVRTTQFDIASVTNLVPVRLSNFTTNFVSIAYSLQSPGQTLASGTLQFAPGETVKFISLPAQPQSYDLLCLQLHDPLHAQITGQSVAWFARSSASSNTVLVPAGAVWKYLDAGTNAVTAWHAPEFDDSGWLYGPAELGFGDTKDGRPEATQIRSTNITYYFRHSFVVTNPTAWSSLTVKLKRDDGGIVYLKDREIFRSNIADGPVDYLTRATLASDDGTTFYSTNAPATLLVAGTNVLAVEIHQESPTSSDVSFDLQLEATPRPALAPARFGQDWLLSWPDPTAVLEQADELTGPWSTVPASSPVQVEPVGPRKFYRLRAQ